MHLYTHMDIKMDIDLAHQAINHALSGDWNKAVTLNLEILKENSKDVEALIRLAKAYSQLGKIKLARLTSQKALKVDPFNSIANKQILKWKDFKKPNASSNINFSVHSFLEEPGKTKMINLINLGETSLLSQMDAGEELLMTSHPHRVSIKTHSGKYVGRLPDDLAARLRQLMKLGNKYQIFIKSSEKNEVKIFVREIFRAEKLKDTPSFPPERIDYVAFTPPELVHKKEGMVEITDFNNQTLREPQDDSGSNIFS